MEIAWKKNCCSHNTLAWRWRRHQGAEVLVQSKAGPGSWWSWQPFPAGCSTSAVDTNLLPGVPACPWSLLPVPVPVSMSRLSLPVLAQPVPTCQPCCLSRSFKGNCVFADWATNKHLNYHCSIFPHIKSHQKSNQLHPNGETDLWLFQSLQLSVRGQLSWKASCMCDGSQ